MNTYLPTIGLETHVQLATTSKLFCGCSNDARDAAPNTLICPVCMGMPGTLPMLNRRAIQLAIRAGLALNGKIAAQTSFDRKNYFYPDLPKGYQITQMDHPIVGPGKIEFPLGDDTITVGITRAHLEEDAGKLTHPAGADYSLVDLNRTGTPLLEIVSEPDLHTPAQAKAYAQEIHNLMLYAGVSAADLYQGNMRFDVNVSVAPEGQLDTRTETKNLNSFKAVERTVEYEIKRQTELLDKGQKIVQETRGWDEAKGQTFSQRSKEDAHDYRYFPEPDLPPVTVTTAMLAEAKATSPNLSLNQLRAKLVEIGSPKDRVEALVALKVVGSIQGCDIVACLLDASQDPSINPADVRSMVFWMIGPLKKIFSEQAEQNKEIKLTTSNLIDVSNMVKAGSLNSDTTIQLLEHLIREGGKAVDAAERHTLAQVSDTTKLAEIVEQVIRDSGQIVTDYKNGNQRALQALVGQVMKASRGQANPAMAGDILKKKLEA